MIVIAVGTFVVAEPSSASPTTVVRVASASAATAPPTLAASTDDIAADSAETALAPATPVVLAAMPDQAEHAEPAPAPAAPIQAAAAAGATQTGYGCGPALAYLAANAAPGFTFQCPGYAYGNQAMTCVNHAPQCAGQRIIAIAVPCPAAYMNEAHNSWVLIGQGTGIDPYGYCH